MDYYMLEVKMAKNTKIIQVVVVDGDSKMLKVLIGELNKLKKKLPFDAEFFVTNDKIKFQDVRVMIFELYKLYKLGEEKNVKD